MGRERTEGERRAAEEFADAVRPETVRFFEAMVNAAFEEFRRNPEVLRVRPEPLGEEEADELALSSVHRVREEIAGEEGEGGRTVFGPPGAMDVDIWAENRELGREERARTWKPPRRP